MEPQSCSDHQERKNGLHLLNKTGPSREDMLALIQSSIQVGVYFSFKKFGFVKMFKNCPLHVPLRGPWAPEQCIDCNPSPKAWNKITCETHFPTVDRSFY